MKDAFVALANLVWYAIGVIIIFALFNAVTFGIDYSFDGVHYRFMLAKEDSSWPR